MYALFKSVKLQVMVSFVISTLLAIAVTSTISAHDFGYKFYSANVTFRAINLSWGSQVQSAADDYNWTALNVSYSTTYSSGPGSIQFYQSNYGASGWIARAQGWNAVGSQCSSDDGLSLTGNCNRTDKKANYGAVYLDLADQAFIDAHPNFVVRHEAGHILGMAHGPCSEDSVMVPNCGTLRATLSTHDKNNMNANY